MSGKQRSGLFLPPFTLGRRFVRIEYMADKYSKEEKQILGQLFRLYRKYYKKPIKEYSEVIPSVTYYRVEKGEAKDEFFYKTAEKLGLTLADPGFLEDYRKIGMEYQAFADAAVLYGTGKMKDHIAQIRSVIGKRAISSPFREILDHAGVLERYYIFHEINDLQVIDKFVSCFGYDEGVLFYWPNVEMAGSSAWRHGDYKAIDDCRPFSRNLPYWLAVLSSRYMYLDSSIWDAVSILETNIDRMERSKYRYFTFIKRLYYLYDVLDDKKAIEYREKILSMFSDPEIPDDQKRASEYNILIRSLLEKDYEYGLEFGRKRVLDFDADTLLIYTMIQSLTGQELNKRVADIDKANEGWVRTLGHFYVLKEQGSSAQELEDYFISRIDPCLAEDQYHPPFTQVFLLEL